MVKNHTNKSQNLLVLPPLPYSALFLMACMAIPVSDILLRHLCKAINSFWVRMDTKVTALDTRTENKKQIIICSHNLKIYLHSSNLVRIPLLHSASSASSQHSGFSPSHATAYISTADLLIRLFGP